MFIENEGGKIATVNKRNRLREFFEGDRKYLVLVLIFVAGIIIYLGLQRLDLISQKINNLIKPQGPTPIVLPSIPPENLKNPWTDSGKYSGVPSLQQSFNYLEYNNLKEQTPTDSAGLTLNTTFAADLIQIDEPKGTNDNLALKVRSRLSANKGKIAWLVFPPDQQKLIQVVDGPGNQLSLQSLKPNDVVVIDQVLEPLQEFENGVKSVKITRL